MSSRTPPLVIIIDGYEYYLAKSAAAIFKPLKAQRRMRNLNFVCSKVQRNFRNYGTGFSYHIKLEATITYAIAFAMKLIFSPQRNFALLWLLQVGLVYFKEQFLQEILFWIKCIMPKWHISSF